jgi:hypothetical protein
MNKIKNLEENNLNLHREIRILKETNKDIILERNSLES